MDSKSNLRFGFSFCGTSPTSVSIIVHSDRRLDSYATGAATVKLAIAIVARKYVAFMMFEFE
jgi:hypothetical protein